MGEKIYGPEGRSGASRGAEADGVDYKKVVCDRRGFLKRVAASAAAFFLTGYTGYKAGYKAGEGREREKISQSRQIYPLAPEAMGSPIIEVDFVAGDTNSSAAPLRVLFDRIRREFVLEVVTRDAKVPLFRLPTLLFGASGEGRVHTMLNKPGSPDRGSIIVTDQFRLGGEGTKVVVGYRSSWYPPEVAGPVAVGKGETWWLVHLGGKLP